MSFPHIDEVYKYIAQSREPLTKREIVRAFNIKGDGRIKLKEFLKRLEEAGKITKGPGQTYAVPNSLPSVTLMKVTKLDIDGDIFGEPLDWEEETQGPPPSIELAYPMPRLKKVTVRLCG